MDLTVGSPDRAAIIYLSLMACLVAAMLIVAADSIPSDRLGYFGTALFLLGIAVMLGTAIAGAIA